MEFTLNSIYTFLTKDLTDTLHVKITTFSTKEKFLSPYKDEQDGFMGP